MRERERWYLLAREEGDISLVGPDKRGRRRTLQSPQHEARCSFRVFQRPSRRPSARGRLERSPVQESSAALEIVLPYAYPAAVPPFDLGHPQCFEAIRAVDKYAVSTL